MRKKRGNIDGVKPLGTRIKEEEPTNVRGGRNSSHREATGMKYALEHTLGPLELIL
jgi:hypothetical protein